MKGKNTLLIKEEFNKNLIDLINKEEKENKNKLALIYTTFIISFFFIAIGTFMSYKNYQKMIEQQKNDKEIVKVVIKEMQG